MEKFNKEFVARVRVYNKAKKDGTFKFYDADMEPQVTTSFSAGIDAGYRPAAVAMHLLHGKMPKQAKVVDIKQMSAFGWDIDSPTFLTDTYEIGISELPIDPEHGRQFSFVMLDPLPRSERKADYTGIPANEVDLTLDDPTPASKVKSEKKSKKEKKEAKMNAAVGKGG